MPEEETQETTSESTESQEDKGGTTSESTSSSASGGDQQTPPWGSDEEFDPSKAWKLIQNLRSDIEELKPKAAKAKELEDAQKSESQRLADQLEAAKSEGSAAKSEAARLKAAIKHGLSEDDLELLGDGTPEQIEERAKRLADRIAGAEGKKPVVPSSRNQGGSAGDVKPDVSKILENIPRL